jgi:L-aspartate oxidase
MKKGYFLYLFLNKRASFMEKKYDFLVIGSGLGGLSFALKAASHGTVCLISKAEMEETNTRYAQGGIAAVTYEPDSHAKHVEDTLVAGDHLCNEEVVKMVVREGPEQIRELIQWGTKFDKQSSGKYDLAREGGHSEHRILHHKDNTGQEIQRALSIQVRKHPKIELLENHFAVDLITQHHLGKLVKRHLANIECYGAYILDLETEQVHSII